MEAAKPGEADDELDGEYGNADDRCSCRGKLAEELPPVAVKDEAEDNGLDQVVGQSHSTERGKQINDASRVGVAEPESQSRGEAQSERDI